MEDIQSVFEEVSDNSDLMFVVKELSNERRDDLHQRIKQYVEYANSRIAIRHELCLLYGLRQFRFVVRDEGFYMVSDNFDLLFVVKDFRHFEHQAGKRWLEKADLRRCRHHTFLPVLWKKMSRLSLLRVSL